MSQHERPALRERPRSAPARPSLQPVEALSCPGEARCVRAAWLLPLGLLAVVGCSDVRSVRLGAVVQAGQSAAAMQVNADAGAALPPPAAAGNGVVAGRAASAPDAGARAPVDAGSGPVPELADAGPPADRADDAGADDDDDDIDEDERDEDDERERDSRVPLDAGRS